MGSRVVALEARGVGRDEGKVGRMERHGMGYDGPCDSPGCPTPCWGETLKRLRKAARLA